MTWWCDGRLYSPCLLCRRRRHKSSCSSVRPGWLSAPSEGQPPCILHFVSIQDTRTWRVWKERECIQWCDKIYEILIRKICPSPVSCRDKVGPILREANCLYFCGYFVACDLEQLPFIENWCCHWNHGISGWECPQAGYGLSSVSLGSNLKSAPMPSYLIFVSPDRILTPVMNVSPLGPWLRCI